MKTIARALRWVADSLTHEINTLLLAIDSKGDYD